MHFPPEFNQKIDMKKVNLKVIKGWMAQRVSQLLGIEDEVVVEYAFGMLEESVSAIAPQRPNQKAAVIAAVVVVFFVLQDSDSGSLFHSWCVN